MEFASTDKERLTIFKNLGFNPRAIYDIGGSNGSWTRATAKVFPEASYYLFEPLANANPAYREGLNNLENNSAIKSQLYPMALGSSSGRISIGVSKSFVGSSVLATEVNKFFPTNEEVDIDTLDNVIKDNSLPYPDLIKMDTQGYELEVLKGSPETLNHVEMILLESWVIRSYSGKTPLMIETMLWLAERGFFLLDLMGEYRNKSGVLVAQDLLFVKQPSTVSALNSDRSFQLTQYLGTDNGNDFSPVALANNSQDTEVESPSNNGHTASNTEVSSDSSSSLERLAVVTQGILSKQESFDSQIHELRKRFKLIRRKMKRQRNTLTRLRDNHRKVREKLALSNKRLIRIEKELEELRSSKFFKARAFWLRVKGKLGLL